MTNETEVLIQASREELAKAGRNISAAWKNIEEMKLIIAHSERRPNSVPHK